jgi:hypothetical protein
LHFGQSPGIQFAVHRSYLVKRLRFGAQGTPVYRMVGVSFDAADAVAVGGYQDAASASTICADAGCLADPLLERNASSSASFPVVQSPEEKKPANTSATSFEELSPA